MAKRKQKRDRAAMAPRDYVLIGIGIFVLSAIVPAAFTNFFDANTTGWDVSTIALWTIIPLVVIAGLLLKFVPGGGRGGT